ncbi:MAG: V-type ATP synthase subunit F [bacterium]
MKFLVIGDKDTVVGFGLVGVRGLVADSETEAMKALKQAIKEQEVGIILITERLAKRIQTTINKLLINRRENHIILQIPDTNGSLSDRPSVEEFVLSALGVNV